MEDWNEEVIRHALSTARRYGFAELELAASGTTFQAKLGPVSRRSGAPIPDSIDEEHDPLSAELTATLVGYYQPAETPLALGRSVQKGDIVAVITALGLANDIESGITGEVVKVMVEPGQSVQYGQVLAQVKLNP